MPDFGEPWWLVIDVVAQSRSWAAPLWRHMVAQEAQLGGGARERGGDERTIYQALLSTAAIRWVSPFD